MYELFPEIQGKVFAVKITGKITEKEKQQLSEMIQERTAQQGGLRLLLVTSDYPSFNSAEDLYDDLGFVSRNAGDIEKLAVVGESPWKSTWVGLFGLFSGLKGAYFEKSNFEEAWNWLTG